MSPPDIVFLLYYICWRLICPELLIGSIVQQTTSLALLLKGWNKGVNKPSSKQAEWEKDSPRIKIKRSEKVANVSRVRGPGIAPR